jgi:Leucine Rich repeat
MSITTLNISANNIGDKGAAALAEMLRSNTTLERLDLSSNVIDYDGISALSAARGQHLAQSLVCQVRSLPVQPAVQSSCWSGLSACGTASAAQFIEPNDGAVTTTLGAWARWCWQTH